MLTPLSALLLAMAQEPPRPALFVEAPRALPDVRTTCGSRAKDWILEVNGGGLALADFDGDQDLDLVVIDGATLEAARSGGAGLPPQLYLNDGKGRFTPAGEAWAMAPGRFGMGCAVGDIDGDGWPDLFVTQWGPDRLFRNLAGRGFEEISASAGLAGERWGSSAAFLDYDRDGHLDLYVVNYLAFDFERVAPPGGGCTWKGHAVMCGPEGLTPVHDQLYRGLGEGKLEEVSAKVRPEAAGFGLGVMTLDYDQDGDTDLYVANDSTPNFLWENRGDGSFAEVGLQRAVSHDANGREQAGMGIACGDADGDGRQDLFVTNFSGESNALYLARKGGGFRESAARTGLGGPSLPSLGWGTTLSDLDLDGDLDIVVLNGHVYPQADMPGTDTSYAQLDHLYRNAGDGRFALEPLHTSGPRVSRALATGDLDQDGDLDLVGLELDGPVRVYMNQTRSPGQEGGPSWLCVRLRGRGGNSAGLGASVRAIWAGGQAQREVRTAGGYQAAVPAEAHFGLGEVRKLERLEVRWPSGRLQVVEGVETGRMLTLTEPEGD